MAAPGDDLRKSLLVPFADIEERKRKLDNDSIDTAKTMSGHRSLGNFLHKKEDINITIDYPKSQDDVPIQDHAVTKPKFELNVMSVDEFLADESIGCNEVKDEIKKDETAVQPPPKKTKANQSSPSLQPQVVSTRSSKYSKLFNEKWQALGMANPATTFEGSTQLGWTARVEFSDLDVEEAQGLSADSQSKQEAKEKVWETAYKVLVELEQNGIITKKKSSSVNGPAPVNVDPILPAGPGENYIGRLLGKQFVLEIFHGRRLVILIPGRIPELGWCYTSRVH